MVVMLSIDPPVFDKYIGLRLGMSEFGSGGTIVLMIEADNDAADSDEHSDINIVRM